jgi:hypothetical protein
MSDEMGIVQVRLGSTQIQKHARNFGLKYDEKWGLIVFL